MLFINNENRFTVKTPEGVNFSLLLAGPIVRFLAWIIDFFIIMTIFQIATSVLGIFNIISSDLTSALSILGFFIISIGYAIVLEWYKNGQTIGKRLCRISVMDDHGLNLSFNQIVIRNLFRFVDSIPFFYLVGGVICILNNNMKRFGDIAAGTIVVRNPKLAPIDLSFINFEKFNSLKQFPHLTARLKHSISPTEANIALRALMRRDSFTPEPRIQLFKEIAFHFKKNVQFPEKVITGMSDEQYVKNIVEILFEKK